MAKPQLSSEKLEVVIESGLLRIVNDPGFSSTSGYPDLRLPVIFDRSGAVIYGRVPPAWTPLENEPTGYSQDRDARLWENFNNRDTLKLWRYAVSVSGRLVLYAGVKSSYQREDGSWAYDRIEWSNNYTDDSGNVIRVNSVDFTVAITEPVTDVFSVPSHLTDTAHSIDYLRRLHDVHGVEGIWYQVQNGGNTPKAYDLSRARQAGMFGGVWGVTYAVDDEVNNPRKLTLYSQNEILGAQAALMHADEVMVDAENVLKKTRAERKAREIIAGLRAGGWKGRVHLTTLGAPLNPLVDDYEMDLLSFIETGGGVWGQAYTQDSSSYRPSTSKTYYVNRMGVPVQKYNTMIWLDTRITPQTHVELLKEAETGRAISVFMTEFGDEPTWSVLDEITRPAGAPVPVDARLTLDPRLVQFRDEVFFYFSQAKAKDPKLFADANPREMQTLWNYFLYRVLFNQPPPRVEGWTGPIDPPDVGSKIGDGGAILLQSAAALIGRLP